MFTYASILVMLAMLNQSEVEVVAQEPKFNRADSSSDTRRCGWNWSSGVFLLLCYTWHDHTWKKTPTMLDNVIFIFIRIKMIATCVSANFPHEPRGRASRDWIRTSMGLDMAVSCTAMFMPSENLGLHVVSMSHGDGDHHDHDDCILWCLYICDSNLRSSRITFPFFPVG